MDLHVHTAASDGVHSPGELVRLARDAGLAAIAVTDHDSLAGLEEAESAGRSLGVEVVRGIELTAYAGRTEVHILGLFVSQGETPASRRVDSLRRTRRERMLRMIENLSRFGILVDPAEVFAEAKDGAVGRPHLAAVLARHGHGRSEAEAFDAYLRQDGPVYVRGEELSPEEAIRLVLELGGLPIYAHPGLSRLDERLGEFREAGLVGLEVWHSRHSPADTEHYLRLAAKKGLLPSGGSDFHGQGRTEASLGTPLVPLSVLEALREAHRRIGRR